MTTIVKLLQDGLARVMDGAVGMTFVVDHFTPGERGPVAHVRDYRFDDPKGTKAFQIWSIGSDGYVVIPLEPEPHEGECVRIKETGQVGDWVQTRSMGPQGERLTILVGKSGLAYVTVPPGYVPGQFIEAVR